MKEMDGSSSPVSLSKILAMLLDLYPLLQAKTSVVELFTVLKASAYKAAQLIEAFTKTFHTQDPDFDWMDVIHWDAPQTDCPEWSDPLVMHLSLNARLKRVTLVDLFFRGWTVSKHWHGILLWS